MKTPNPIVILCLLLATPLAADTTPADAPMLSPPEVETLVSPIALYPDALVAIILPASVNSTDIVLAARFLEKGGATDQIARQPWDESVRSLAYYPEVLKWMDENLEWTQQLGVTFLAQPEEVMAAIQRLRARAHALGNLPSTGQLTVVAEQNYIRIVPAEPERIYVPYYDPEVIFVSRFYWGFGPAWHCGPWLSFDCNWISRSIWIGTWQPHYFYRPPWVYVVHRPPSPRYVDRHTWRPDPRRIAANPRPPPPRPGHIVRPRPIADVRFDRPGHPPPTSQHTQRPANVTERRAPGKTGTPPRQQPASTPRQSSQTQLNTGSSKQTPPPATTSQPAQRQTRDSSKSRVVTPGGNPPAPHNNTRVTQRPGPPSSTPTPRQAAQQGSGTTRATPPPESPRQSTSGREKSDSTSSGSTNASSNASSSRATGSSDNSSSNSRATSSNSNSSNSSSSNSNSSNSSSNTSSSTSSSRNTSASDSRSSYSPSSSSSSSRSAPPPAPRESSSTRPGAR